MPGSWSCTGSGTRRPLRRAAPSTAATATRSPSASWPCGRTRRSAWETPGCGPGRPCRPAAPAGWIRSWGRSPGTWSLDRWRPCGPRSGGRGQAELALTELGDCLPRLRRRGTGGGGRRPGGDLNRFLESLPQEKRVLFVRRYWYLCSVEELAAWSGRRRGTVSAALFRLRQDLREHLEREGFTL